MSTFIVVKKSIFVIMLAVMSFAAVASESDNSDTQKSSVNISSGTNKILLFEICTTNDGKPGIREGQATAAETISSQEAREERITCRVLPICNDGEDPYVRLYGFDKSAGYLVGPVCIK